MERYIAITCPTQSAHLRMGNEFEDFFGGTARIFCFREETPLNGMVVRVHAKVGRIVQDSSQIGRRATFENRCFYV